MSDGIGAMFQAIATLPEQLAQSYERARGVVPLSERAPRTVVVCGMGGSGVGGDLVPAAFACSAPVIAVKGYDLPAWVGPDDCVICVSYSGETAETLSCYAKARSVSQVAAVISAGGTLSQHALREGVPVVAVTPGFQPRAAVGMLFASLVAVCESLCVIEDASASITEAAAAVTDVLEEENEASYGTSRAAVIARALVDRVVLLYGAGLTVAVASRWKAQINENGKAPAFASAYPELDHNEIVGWERAGETGARWTVVELVPFGASDAIRARFDVTGEIIDDDLEDRVRVEAPDGVPAASLMSLVALGDLVSVHMAAMVGVDPVPVERIATLKKRLAGG